MGLVTLALISIYYNWSLRQAGRRSKVVFGVIYSLVSILMLIDVNYYKYFVQYVSVNQLYQLSSLMTTAGQLDLSSVVGAVASIFLVLDIPFVISIMFKSEKEYKQNKLSHIIAAGGLLVIFIIGLNPLKDDSFSSINHLEFLTYHTRDVIAYVNGSVVRAKVDQKEIQAKIKENVPVSTGDQYRGIGKGKNLIVIQMESFQNFLINGEYNGEEITPNINKLLQKDSIYFSNYYQSIGKGNTSDAEFATMNSFYPAGERESYRLYVDNTYNGLPWLMRHDGYKAMAFHGYIKTFWNREEAYIGQGFQEFYSEERLVMTEKSGFGLTDKEMFKQAVAILKEEKQPTFSFMITLTNHIPYQLDQKLCSLKVLPADEGTMFGRYMQSARYADEAIGELIQLLKDNGMYDNTVIAMYGDHHGMLNEYPEVKASMEKHLDKAYDYDEMLNVPCIIHLPNSGIAKTVETVGGQVDFLPTITNIMDIDIPQPYVFGKDLLNTDDSFVASVTYLNPGSFIKDDIMYQIGRDNSFEKGRAWSIKTGETLTLDGLKQYQERATELIRLSKKALDFNLMADYPPKP